VDLLDVSVFTAFFIIGITGCGPNGSVNDRIASSRSITAVSTPNAEASIRESRLSVINRELLDSTDVRPNPDAATESELDAKAKEAQNLITSLNMELSIQRATDGDELQALRDRQEQSSRAQQSLLADLRMQIQNQERRVAEKQSAMTMAIAPEGGDLRNQVEGDYAQAVGELNRIRSKYSSLLLAQSSNPDQYYSEQRIRLDSLRSRQNDFSAMIQSAKAELAEVSREKATLRQANRLRTVRMNQLRAERDSLLNPR
jgi:hypothetical protein